MVEKPLLRVMAGCISRRNPMLMPNIPPYWMYELARNARTKVLTQYRNEGLTPKEAKRKLAFVLPWNAAMSYAKDVRKKILEQVFGRVEHSKDTSGKIIEKEITHRMAQNEDERKIRKTVIPREDQPIREYPKKFKRADLDKITGLDIFKRPLTSQRLGTSNITDVVSDLPEKDVEYKFKFELPLIPGLKNNPFSEDDMSLVALMNPPEQAPAVLAQQQKLKAASDYWQKLKASGKSSQTSWGDVRKKFLGTSQLEKEEIVMQNPLYDNPAVATFYRKLLYDEARQAKKLAKKSVKDSPVEKKKRQERLGEIRKALPKKKDPKALKAKIKDISAATKISQKDTRAVLERFFYGLPGHKEVLPTSRGAQYGITQYYKKFPHVKSGGVPPQLAGYQYEKSKKSEVEPLLSTGPTKEEKAKEAKKSKKATEFQKLMLFGYNEKDTKKLLAARKAQRKSTTQNIQQSEQQKEEYAKVAAKLKAAGVKENPPAILSQANLMGAAWGIGSNAVVWGISQNKWVSKDKLSLQFSEGLVRLLGTPVGDKEKKTLLVHNIVSPLSTVVLHGVTSWILYDNIKATPEVEADINPRVALYSGLLLGGIRLAVDLKRMNDSRMLALQSGAQHALNFERQRVGIIAAPQQPGQLSQSPVGTQMVAVPQQDLSNTPPSGVTLDTASGYYKDNAGNIWNYDGDKNVWYVAEQGPGVLADYLTAEELSANSGVGDFITVNERGGVDGMDDVMTIEELEGRRGF